MFEKYVEQALSIFNYVDSIVLTDARGIIRYFHTNRQDINMLDNSQVIGKHILEMYANLTPESSTILKVLRSGQPVLNKKQELVNILLPVAAGEKSYEALLAWVLAHQL